MTPEEAMKLTYRLSETARLRKAANSEAELATVKKISVPDIPLLVHLLEIDPRQFSQSTLPQTMELALVLKSILLPLVRNAPQGWPFHDRVLLWLVPSLENDIRKFHESSSNSLRDMFPGDGVRLLDQILLTLLGAQVERIRPDVIRLLQELSSAPKDGE